MGEIDPGGKENRRVHSPADTYSCGGLVAGCAITCRAREPVQVAAHEYVRHDDCSAAEHDVGFAFDLRLA